MDETRVLPGEPTFGRVARESSPLLVGMTLLMLGLGLLQSLIGVRASIEGFPTALTGVLMSAYYVGFLIGSLWIPRVVSDVGHIRAFAALASTASVAFVVHGVFVNPASWVVLRLLGGLCVAGAMVVSETWLNGRSTNTTRGQLLAVYTVLTFGGLGGGQLLLNVEEPAEIGLFVLASVLVSVALVPIALSRNPAPVVEELTPMRLRQVFQTSPVAIVGATGAGVSHGALLGIGAVYVTAIGLGVAQVSAFMAAALGGAMLSQIPVGKLSDRTDRRRIIAAVALLACGAAVAATFYAGPGRPLQLVGFAAAIGAFTFPLYPLAIAQLSDNLEAREMVGAGSRIVMVYGMGAIAGPFTVTIAMSFGGPVAFLWYQAGVHGLIALYTLYRLTRYAPVVTRSPFAPYPSATSPALLSLTPEMYAQDVHPEQGHDVAVPGAVLRVRERGSGPPVVLVHDVASSSRVWQHQLRGLSRSGYRVIAYDLRGHGRSGAARGYVLRDHVGDLRALVDAVGATRPHLVGLGAGAAIVVAFADAHPEHVRSVTVVSCARTIMTASVRSRADVRFATLMESTVSRVLPRRTVARRFARTAYDPAHHPDRYALIAEDASQARTRAVAQTLAAAVPGFRSLRALSVPTLVVLGRRDRATSKAIVERMRQTFPGGRVEVLAEAAYYVNLDDPHGFNELLREHFEHGGG